jgi:hypothetical protein
MTTDPNFWSFSVTDLLFGVVGAIAAIAAVAYSRKQNLLVAEANRTANDALAEVKRSNTLQEEAFQLQRDQSKVVLKAQGICRIESHKLSEEGPAFFEGAELEVVVVNEGVEVEVAEVGLGKVGWVSVYPAAYRDMRPFRLSSRSRVKFEFYDGSERMSNHAELCSLAEWVQVTTACGHVVRLDDAAFRCFVEFAGRLTRGEVPRESPDSKSGRQTHIVSKTVPGSKLESQLP